MTNILIHTFQLFFSRVAMQPLRLKYSSMCYERIFSLTCSCELSELIGLLISFATSMHENKFLSMYDKKVERMF